MNVLVSPVPVMLSCCMLNQCNQDVALEAEGKGL